MYFNYPVRWTFFCFLCVVLFCAMNCHTSKQVIFSLFWAWVVVVVRYLLLVIFIPWNNEDVVLDVLPQKNYHKNS